ncbi:MAG TPA: transglutaminase-like domain-containing protein [Candidatus Nanoarchaeia archaeon]|nr:transglutaminase-like domain-containing protein [Candidatus Nanoarchaeia archaeon]
MTNENNNIWLKEGEQSKVTPRIKKIGLRFKGKELEKIVQILNWIEKNISSESNPEKIQSIFASRTADQIIADKKDTGCHDTTLLLVIFLRAIGIPTKYLLGIDKENPTRGGHCVAEAYIGERWILIDPTYFQINLIPDRSSFYKENHIVKKGLDSWDCGVKTVDDWKTISDQLIKRKSNKKTN